MKERAEIDFEKLIEEYTSILLNKAYYLLSNKEDAEDLVQEVFYSAYINYRSYSGKGTLLSWLQSILYNKAMDFYKKKYKYGTKIHVNFTSDFDKHGEWNHNEITNHWFGEDKSEQENLLDNIEFREQFYGCLDSLPQKWSIIMRLCYLNNNKAEYICTELGITLSRSEERRVGKEC